MTVEPMMITISERYNLTILPKFTALHAEWSQLPCPLVSSPLTFHLQGLCKCCEQSIGN